VGAGIGTMIMPGIGTAIGAGIGAAAGFAAGGLEKLLGVESPQHIPTLGGIASGTYPTPGGPNTASGTGGPTYLSLNISGSDVANFMTGNYVTPQFVTDQSMAAQNSSYGRTQQSANMQVPGLTIA
jgi:hypothetical protein